MLSQRADRFFFRDCGHSVDIGYSVQPATPRSAAETPRISLALGRNLRKLAERQLSDFLTGRNATIAADQAVRESISGTQSTAVIRCDRSPANPRPERPIAIRSGNDRSGFLTGRRLGEMAGWPVFDIVADRNQPTLMGERKALTKCPVLRTLPFAARRVNRPCGYGLHCASVRLAAQRNTSAVRTVPYWWPPHIQLWGVRRSASDVS